MLRNISLLIIAGRTLVSEASRVRVSGSTAAALVTSAVTVTVLL